MGSYEKIDEVNRLVIIFYLKTKLIAHSEVRVFLEPERFLRSLTITAMKTTIVIKKTNMTATKDVIISRENDTNN